MELPVAAMIAVCTRSDPYDAFLAWNGIEIIDTLVREGCGWDNSPDDFAVVVAAGVGEDKAWASSVGWRKEQEDREGEQEDSREGLHMLSVHLPDSSAAQWTGEYFTGLARSGVN